MGGLHNHRRVGPLLGVFFEQLATFHQIVRIAGIIYQACSEELALILEGGRVTNQVVQIPVDLNHTTGSTTCVK